VLTVKRLTYKVFSIAVLILAAAITGLSIRQAVRQDSLDPLVLIGWLPAVLVGAYYRRPASGWSCSGRLLRRRHS
jgi:hypothetical protein